MTSIRRSARSPRFGWGILIGLLLLSAVPILAGAMRVGQLGSSAPVTPENARFFLSPIPVVAHIVGATLFSLLGAVQLTPGIRRRWPRWHRLAGRFVVAPSGVVVALSGLWMAVMYDLPDRDGVALQAMRLIVGVGMLTALALAVLAIRRGDVAGHGAWMIRAYALALGAGTQVLTVAPVSLAGIQPDVALYAVLMGAGWAINLGFAEWVIRRRMPRAAARRAESAAAVAASAVESV